MFFYLLSVHWRNYLVKPDGKDTSFLLIIYQFYLKKEKMLVVLHISIQRTSIFKKLLLAYGEDINIFVFDSKAPNWDQEGMSKRGSGALRRSQEGSTAPLRYLCAHEQD